jgi:ABC-type nitrate/sulfonate/bicarbonate transport system permease component
VDGIEVERAAQPPVHRRLPRFYFAGLLSVLGGLLLWEVVSRFLVANTLFLAAPSQIFTAIVALARSGELWRHMSVSAIEFALGYVIASVLGVIIGFAMAESPTAKRALQPWISGLYATPTIALAPLFILWLGIGIWSKVLVVIFLDAAADILQGLSALSRAVHPCRAQARHRTRSHRRRGRGTVRLARRARTADRAVGGCLQHARVVRRRRRARCRWDRAHSRFRMD